MISGCEIFSHLSQSQYTKVIRLIEHSIISTDLAVYFQRRKEFFDVVDTKSYDWTNEKHKSLLRSMVMTSTDVAAITKPWQIQRKIAQEIAEEFFEQGDFEKERLHQNPKDMMNRDLKHKLPEMQIGFIDAICLPLYQKLAKVSPKLKPLVDGCLNNRKKWGKEGEHEKTVTVF